MLKVKMFVGWLTIDLLTKIQSNYFLIKLTKYCYYIVRIL